VSPSTRTTLHPVHIPIIPNHQQRRVYSTFLVYSRDRINFPLPTKREIFLAHWIGRKTEKKKRAEFFTSTLVLFQRQSLFLSRSTKNFTQQRSQASLRITCEIHRSFLEQSNQIPCFRIRKLNRTHRDGLLL
jgi:hypothetical protein